MPKKKEPTGTPNHILCTGNKCHHQPLKRHCSNIGCTWYDCEVCLQRLYIVGKDKDEWLVKKTLLWF